MNIIDALDQDIARLHASGLPSTHDDIMSSSDAEGADIATMSEGHHFSYTTQTWVDGNDHAHLATGNNDLPLLFCGGDLASCCPTFNAAQRAR